MYWVPKREKKRESAVCVFCCLKLDWHASPRDRPKREEWEESMCVIRCELSESKRFLVRIFSVYSCECMKYNLITTLFWKITQANIRARKKRMWHSMEIKWAKFLYGTIFFLKILQNLTYDRCQTVYIASITNSRATPAYANLWRSRSLPLHFDSIRKKNVNKNDETSNVKPLNGNSASV